MMSKRGSVSDIADQRLKVEFARRKNRRASITEQFAVPVAKSKRQERLAQAHHYEFLLHPENHAEIERIVRHVRRLVDTEALSLGHVLSPMDKHRLHSWGNDVLALLSSFEPSDDRDNDPLVRLLEQLQGLQAGHVCLAEVAIEARHMVEKWEHSGIFDDSRNSDEEEEEEDALRDMRSPQQRALDWEKAKRRKMEASYAYQCVRERAAAHVIKRNTLKWVRSRAAFCSRVEELEVFGNTTAALVEELTALSDLQRRAVMSSTSNSTNVYDLVKGKKLIAGGHKIDFTDLMHFSKHLALFTVDHAVRRIGEIQRKRRLIELWCAVKLQTWWRKMRDTAKGRRMLRLLEEVRRKKEEERPADLLRQKEMKAKATNAKSSDSSGKKNGKVGKSDKAAVSTLGALANPSSSSRSVTSPNAPADVGVRSVNTKANHRTGAAKDTKSIVPTPPSTPKPSTHSSGGGASRTKKQSVIGTKDDKLDRISRAARARQSRLRKEFEEEMKRRRQEDEDAERDTEDVKEAWKRFIESARETYDSEDMRNKDERVSTASSLASSGLDSRGPTPHVGDEVEIEEWREWSDDEANALSDRGSRATTPYSVVSSRLSTPQSDASTTRPPSNEARLPDNPSRPMPPAKVVVTVRKQPPPRQTKPLPPTPPAAEPRNNDDDDSPLDKPSPTDGLVLPYAAAPSPSRRQLLFGTSQARHSRPVLPGTGQLTSNFLPFAELSAQPSRLRTPPVATAVTPRRPLHEIDFTQPQLADASANMDMFMRPLVEDSPMTEDTRTLDTNETQPVTLPMRNPVRVFSSIRANRVARIRAVMEAKSGEYQSQSIDVVSKGDQAAINADVSPLQDTLTPDMSPAIGLGAVIFVNNNVRDALLRPIRGRASMVEAYISNPMLKLDFRMEDVKRKVEEPQPPSEVVAPESNVFAEQPISTPSKAKFGSHKEWLQSMGLDNAAGIATRTANGSPPKAVRSAKKKESQVQQQLVSSILTIEDNTADKAKRNRRKEHGLPLLGRRSPNKTKAAQQAKKQIPAEEIENNTLPPMMERGPTKGGPPQHRRSRVRTPTSRDRSEPAPNHMHSTEEDPVVELSLHASVDTSGDSDVASTNSSDISSNESYLESSRTSEDEGDDPTIESHGNEESSEESESGSVEDADESTAVDTTRGRRTSRRVRRSERSVKRTKRSSLHETRYKKEREKRSKDKKQQKRKNKAAPVVSEDESESRQLQPETEEYPPVQKRRWHFRKRTSLLQRLVPKGTRVSSHLHQSDASGDPDGFGWEEGDESCDLQFSEEMESPDPEQAEAFYKLYSQYMGLLNAVPMMKNQT